MIGHRTRYSMAQMLEQQPSANVVTLLAKHGGYISIQRGSEMHDILNAVRALNDHQVMAVLAEAVATSGDLRHRVSPKTRFDERLHDLVQCLTLDGYQVVQKRLVQTDPSIADAAPIDDDLVDALRTCGVPSRAAILQKIEDSAQAFRTNPPDYNASLVNARVALETLAGDVAQAVAVAANATALPFDPTKWGSMVNYLRSSGRISLEEEKGLVGVYALLSAGAHRPMITGISEAQMTRLGRSFALNMCWFLLQNHLGRILG